MSSLLRSISKDSLESWCGPRGGALVGCDAQAGGSVLPRRHTEDLDGLLQMLCVPWDLRQHNRAHAMGNVLRTWYWRGEQPVRKLG